MEQRMNEAEGDIRSLQEWRRDTVDPFMRDSEVFDARSERFMTSFEATEKVRMQLAEERHKSNSFKLNVLMFLLGLLGLIFSGMLALFSYDAAHQKSFMNVPAVHVQNQQYDAQRNPGTMDSAVPATIAMHAAIR